MKKSTDKRTLELKALLEKEIVHKRPVLLQMQDDLGGAAPLPYSEAQTSTQSIKTNLDPKANHPSADHTPRDLAAPQQSIMAMASLLNKEITKSAASLDLDEAELRAWLHLQQSAPSTAVLALLRTMRHFKLDPLCDELSLMQHEDGHWQAHVTIEGCYTLLNRHPQFNGLTFSESDTSIVGIPEWIECTIYRRDRAMPISVREYLVEVQADKPIWKKMPRRMLRHRAMQQCVRLAID